MEKIVEQGLLYDFYGELLTKHQRQIYERIVYDNLSLGEIAQEEGISRQAVHDIVKRCRWRICYRHCKSHCGRHTV